MRRVVVTGLGALTPIGNTVAEYNEGLKAGRSGAADIKNFDATSFKTRFAAELKSPNIEAYIEKRAIRRLDRFSQYALVVAGEAINDSGLDLDKLDMGRAGVVWGSGIGGLETIETEIHYNATSSMPRYNPYMVPKMIADIAPGHISIKYGFQGVNFGTVSACASSSHAFLVALDNIRVGRSDLIVTGGSEASVIRTGIGGFGSMKALSRRNDDPSTASRPFDKDRDGFVLGEGAGCMIFEEYEHARRRGATIYAEVLGGAATADAHHVTAPHPDGRGASAVMKLSLADAKLNPDQIDYINVHGTSTPLGDIAELKAISNVFGDHAYNLNISSTKSMTGHLLGASGAIEGIAAILGMRDNYVPPTINHFTDDPNIDSKLNLTFGAPQDRILECVLSNTFGFGGHNACIVFKKV